MLLSCLEENVMYKTISELASELGCSEGTVRRYIKEFNLGELKRGKLEISEWKLSQLKEKIDCLKRQHTIGRPWGTYE